ncbi:MAG TPA: leucyl aminopeptidase [Streptosporangiaceae bacterium]|nr:leucyl aminopeptidase [Streptosporangiaceae bacterium]
MPIDTRLTAVAAVGPRPLASYLAGLGSGAQDTSGTPGPVVVPVQGADAAGIDPYLGAPAAEVVARCEAGGDAGDLTSVVIGPDGPGPFLFLGLGNESPAAMRKAGAAVGRRVAPGRTLVTSAVCGKPAEAVHAFTVGLLLGSYRWSQKRDEAGPDDPPGEVRLLVAGPDGQAGVLAAARAVADAVALARDLTNTPSGRKSPRWLADQAVAMATGCGLTARVWDAGELAARGFGGLLAVGAGSARPPCLIELGYQPDHWEQHVVLAGKGITFDSGGLSLKPADGMKLMKTDMAGGAAVIAVMSALGRLGVRSRVTGLVAAAENMPSGSALRPGDVITHFGGRTVEVLNTDAEGRLVLADALAYADAELRPDAMVDIATLTGAVRVALGTQMGALYASDERLAADLLAAGRASGDALWRMPLVDDYSDALDSPVADLANVPHGSRPRAGSIDAALFLREFTGGRSWAHLDIAGAARSAADEGENTKGGTGYGTRLLLAWLAGPLAALDGGQHAVPDRQQ